MRVLPYLAESSKLNSADEAEGGVVVRTTEVSRRLKRTVQPQRRIDSPHAQELDIVVA